MTRKEEIKAQFAQIEKYLNLKREYLATHNMTEIDWIVAGKPNDAEMKEAARG